MTPIAAIAAPRVILGNKAPSSKSTRQGSIAGEANNTAGNDRLANAPVPEPAPAPPFAAVLTATMTDNRPGTDPASAKPGDTINYTVTIQNTGDADATGIQFNDDLDLHTAYVNGSGLLAMADSYSTISNVSISVPDGATDLLNNDRDLTAGNNTGMTATAQTVSSTNCTGGCSNNVTINANGSFTYDPPVGFTGTDSFTYVSHNAANTRTAQATVQITVTGRIWFINNTAGACTSNCDGRLSHPFQTLAQFQAVNDNGVALNHPKVNDSIFIYTGTANYTGGTTLLNGQKLIGQGATVSLETITGLTTPSGSPVLPSTGGANPVLTTGSLTDNVRLGTGNSNLIRGFTVGDSGTATGDSADISGTNIGTLTVSEVTLNGSGRTMNINGGALSGSFTSVLSNASTGQGLTLGPNLVTGSINMGTTTISGWSTGCITVSNTTANVNFGNTSCTGGTGSEGVNLTNNSGGTRTFGTLTVSGISATAFIHSTAGGDVNITGAATLSTAGNAISVSAPASGDLIDFQAATSATTTGAGVTGVNWAGAAGATMQFSSLSIQRNNGIALNATTGGTITINNTGSASTITNTTAGGPAIVANTIALNATFNSINSSGGTNGVSLTTVTGTSNFGTGALSGATGATFLVSGGTASVTYNGNMTQATASQALVSVSNGHQTGTLSFQGTNSATNGIGLQFNNADGTYNFNGTSNATTLNGGDAGIDITNGSAGSFTFGKSGTPTSFVITKGNAGNALDVDGTAAANTGSVTYNGNITQSNTGAMVNVLAHSTGTISFDAAGTLSATNGTGLQFSNADGTYNFNGTTTLNGGDAGIDILNGSAGTFNFGGTTITNPSGVGLNVDGTAAANTGGITISGTIQKNNAGKLIDFNNYDTGTATISGTLTCTATCGGVEVTNDGTSSGTVTFSGGTKTLNTGANTAVNLDNNDSGTVNFTNGGLDIDTTSGSGFSATNGGTVNIGTGGSNNTIDTDTGVGIRIDSGTNIGGTGVTLRSITVDNGASASATSGIILNGTSGAFLVSGDGTTTSGLFNRNGSGGTINRATDDAIQLTNATNVTIRQMNITNNGNAAPAILADAENTTGDQAVQINGGGNVTISAVLIDTPTGSGYVGLNMTGTNKIDNNSLFTNFADGIRHGVYVNNTNTNMTLFQMKDSTMNNSLNDATMFMFVNSGTSNMILDMKGNTFENLDVQAVLISPGGSVGTTGTLTATVGGPNAADRNKFQHAHSFVIAGPTTVTSENNLAVLVTNGATGDVTFENNLFDDIAEEGQIANTSVLRTQNAGGKLTAVVKNNVFQNINYLTGAGGRHLIGHVFEPASFTATDFSNLTITGNTATNVTYTSTNREFVFVDFRQFSSKGNVTVSNNNFNMSSAGSQQALELRFRPQNSSNVNVAVTGNVGTFNTAARYLDIDAEESAHLSTTVTGNNFTDSDGANGDGMVFTTEDNAAAGSSPTHCVNVSGNTLTGFGGGGFSGIVLQENVEAMTVQQTSSANVSAVNGGTNVSVTGTPTFGVTCTVLATKLAPGLGQPSNSAEVAAVVDHFRDASVNAEFATNNRTVEIAASAASFNQLPQASVVAFATIAKNDHSESGSLASWFGTVTRPVAQLAHSVDALITPATQAAAAPSAQSQKSDVRLNHARGVRSGKARATTSALMPFAPCGAITSTHICVDIGTLHAGESVQISFSATVNNPPNLSLLNPAKVTTQGVVSSSLPNVLTNDPDTVAAGDSTDTPIDLFDVNVALGSSLNPSEATDPVTYTATITVDTSVQTPPGGTNPTGTVTFKDNAIAIGTCTNVAITGSGPWTAQCTIAGGTYTGGSSHPITATYNGDGNFDPKTSSTLTQTVNACNAAPVVTKIADTNDGTCDGDCSLREAIGTACTGATITFNTAGVFATPQTITIDTALAITKNLTIDAPSLPAQHVTVARNIAMPNVRIFSVQSGKTVSIDDVTITGGSVTGSDGGGIVNHGTLTLNNVTVNANSTDASGGGIYNDGTLTVIGSTFSGNTSALVGGGIASDTTLSVVNSTVSGNGSDSGGGISSQGTMTMINTTVSGNTATFTGGGLRNGGPATVINSTITNNRADNDTDTSGDGGGAWLSAVSSITFKSTIIAGNFKGGSPSTVADDIKNFGTLSGSFNLIGDAATSGGLTDGVSGNIVGVGGVGTRPIATILDTTLGNNGGPTQTHKLVASGPAVEAGTDATTLNGGIDNVTNTVVVTDASTIPAGVGFLIQIDNEQMSVTSKATNTLTVVRAANGTTAASHSNGAGVNPAFDQRGSGFPRKADSADANTTQTVDIGAYELHPTVEDIADKSTAEDTGFNFNFNIGDGTTTPTLITSVTATSNNAALVTNANLVITGSGATRNLAITPVANANTPLNGTATITVTVMATNGQTAQDTFVLTVTAVADTPSVTNASTFVNLQSSTGLVISRNVADGAETGFFKITNIQNGTLFKNDGLTQINNNDFITFLEGNAGLKFTPALNSTTSGTFDVQGSNDGVGTGLSSGVATATITVTKSNTTTAVTSSQNPSFTGQNVTFTATVTSSTAYVGPPTGTVDFFFDNGGGATLIPGCGAKPLNGSGVATCTTNTLTAGNNTITTTYSGDAAFNPSNGTLNTNPQVINAALALVVNQTGDAADANPGDGICDTDLGTAGSQCTLRAAIHETNLAPSPDSISFSLAPNSTITVLTALPGILGDLTINGPGAGTLTVMRSTAGGTPDFNIFTIVSNLTVTISGLTINNGNNPGGLGGGIYNLNSNLTIEDCIISGNHADGGGVGGGILNNATGPNNATLTINNSTISGNTASSYGGGVYNLADGGGGTASLTITNSTISGNSALAGAGVASNINIASTGTLTITNSTISGNNANDIGGGIVAVSTTTNLTNVTVTNNRTDNDNDTTGTGGGLHVASGTVTLKNTIVWGNFKGSSPSTTADDISGTVDPASSFNLIGTGGAGGLTNGVNNNQVGVLDARLGPLANNGGPTFTHALLPGSPAFDAGDNSVTGGPLNLTDDQRGSGFLRSVDGPDANTTATVDVGAFEAQVSIEDIGDQTINEDNQLQFTFNVNDGISSANVSGTSGNTTVVPNANILITGASSPLTFTLNPAADQNGGPFTITVTVTNGPNTMSDTFQLTVNAVNDAPTFQIPSPPPAVDEDAGASTVVGFATSFQPGPVTATDEAGQTLVGYTLSPTGSTGSLTFSSGPAISNAGTLTYTPTANTSGTATFNAVATDSFSGVAPNVNQSAPVSFTITVNSVNDPPSFTIASNPAAVNEDAGATTVNSFATSISAGAADESGQVLTFTVSPTGTTGNLAFSSAPAIDSTTGNLTYTTSPDTNGTATFNVTLSDNGSNVPPNSNTSGTQSFTITVNAVNDAPTFQILSPPPAVNEDAGATTVNSFATNFQPGPATATDETGQTLVGYTLSLTGSTGSLTFSSGPAIDNTGKLTYTPTANTNGTATYNVVATDSGSGVVPNVNQSAPVAFTITVNAQNDNPTLTTNAGLSVVDGTSGTIDNTRLQVDDVDNTAAQLVFTIGTATTNGTVKKGGVGLSAGGTFTQADINANQITYQHTNLGTTTDSFTFTVIDGAGGSLGLTTFNITITPACVTNPIVINNADSGAGSLRQAIADACVGSTITFDMNQVTSPITLTSGEIIINKNLTITGPGADLLTISGNSASRIFNLSGGSTNTISGLTFANASVSGGGTNHGGAIFNNANLTITGSAFSGNTVNGGTSNQGGAIFNSGTLSLTSCTLSANSAAGAGSNSQFGGAISNTGTLTLTNCTISGNLATGGITSVNRGAGVYNGSGTLTIVNSTLSGNTVAPGATSEGGGIDVTGGTVNVRNTIVAGNTAATGADVAGAFTSQGNNLIGVSDGSTGFTNGVNGDKVGSAGSPLNALLSPLGNYGGPTQTRALLPGSPAIDAGNNCVTAVAHCSDANIAQITLDQRGLARQVGSNVDIGAFESRGFTVVATSGTPQSTPILTAFGSPLLATVTSGFGEPVTGGQLTFTAPVVGASATFTGGVSTIAASVNGSGQASVSATANGTAGGPYNVSVSASGISSAANFILTNQKGNQTITFAGIANRTFGDADFVVSPTASSGLAVSLAASGNCTVTTPSPGTVHITGAGACTITASQAGDANYNPAANVPQGFSIAKANQTITFGALSNKTFGDADFNVNPTASSGLAVSLGASGNCTVTTPAPGTVHITGAGSCTITASQAGDANYNAATNVPQSFNIAKANQTITFGALANRTFGDADFNVSPTASSGLAVSLAASGNCTVTTPAPGTVHITGAGSCTITASQAGDANYNAAANVPQSFNIAKASSTTAVSSSVNPSDFGQTVTFTATVSSGAGTPTGTVQFKDNGTNIGAAVALNGSGQAQVSTSTLTVGTHTITADYSGDSNFLVSTGTLTGGQVVKPVPTLSIDDVSTTEGQAGTKVLNFTVTLSAASNLTVTVNFATSNVSATAGSDYVAIPSTVLTFNPGDLTKTIPVTINGDVGFEPDETFNVTLSGPTNATLNKAVGTGTIQNDDAQGGFLSFNSATYGVNEVTGFVTVTIVRTNDVSQPATVDYATDDTGSSTDCSALLTGLASQRCDYTSLFGTLKFAANETQKTLDIPINLDAYTEGPETFTVKLSNPTGGAVLSAPSTAIVTITDSASPTPNAIDDTTTFVRQQYRDFLNRDADSAGLAFWKNNIDKCNDPAQRPPAQTLAQCIEVQRITTSAAFFLSIEFRQTGGMVRDFYVASLNRPLTNNMPDFVEFMRDTQAIQKGVVVGVGNWQQVLDANRLAFMNEFVTRAEFVGLYPTTDSPTLYVDKLYQHAAVPPANPGERDAAIAEFGNSATASDTTARAKALLRITQNPTFQARELLRGFVQMQYLGYLRRNPNAPPDNNFSGYDFWLQKLIQFNGDFLQAEMVKAFLTSLEYRKRFGP